MQVSQADLYLNEKAKGFISEKAELNAQLMLWLLEFSNQLCPRQSIAC